MTVAIWRPVGLKGLVIAGSDLQLDRPKAGAIGLDSEESSFVRL